VCCEHGTFRFDPFRGIRQRRAALLQHGRRDGSAEYFVPSSIRGQHSRECCRSRQWGCTVTSPEAKVSAGHRNDLPDRGNFIPFRGDLSSRPLVHRAIGSFGSVCTLPSEGAVLSIGIQESHGPTIVPSRSRDPAAMSRTPRRLVIRITIFRPIRPSDLTTTDGPRCCWLTNVAADLAQSNSSSQPMSQEKRPNIGCTGTPERRAPVSLTRFGLSVETVGFIHARASCSPSPAIAGGRG